MNVWRIAIDEATGAAAGEPEPVTAGVGPFEQPRLSADGRRLVFRVQTTAVNPVALAFDPAAETIGAPRQILDRSGRLIPTGVSPDGQWLALWNQFERQEDVFVIRTDGTGFRRLTDDLSRDRRAVWSPDQQEVAFASNRGGSYAIWAVKPDGSGLRQLTGEPADPPGNLLCPTYSPTGDRMVASRLRTPEAYLFDPRSPSSSQSPERLSFSVSEDRWLVPTAWSPDGSRIAGAIVTGSGAGTGLGVFELATRSVRSVLDLPVRSVGFSWLPDSRRLLFTDLSRKTWLIDVDSGRRRELPLDFQTGTGLLVSPDGRTVYTSITRDRADLWLAEVR